MQIFGRIFTTYHQSFTGLRKEVWLLSLVVLINRCGTMAIPFMSIYITQGLGRSISDAGWVISLFGVGAVIGTQIGGMLTDKFGFRVVQIGTTLLAGVNFFVFSLTDDFVTLCMLTVALGAFAEAFKPANFTAIAAYAKPENLTRSYSLNRLAVNIGFSLGATAGGVLAAINYKLLFWVEGSVYILVGLLVWILLPSRKLEHRAMKEAMKGQVVLSPWKDTVFLRIMFFATIYTTCFIIMFRLVPVFWKEAWQIDESKIGLLLGLNGLIISVFEMVLVHYMERKAKQRTFLLSGILITVLAYLFLQSSFGFPLLLAGFTMIIFTLGEMLTFPHLTTLVSARANEANRGQYAAIYSFTWSFAQVIGPAGGALLVSVTSYHWLWLALMALGGITFVGMRKLV